MYKPTTSRNASAVPSSSDHLHSRPFYTTVKSGELFQGKPLLPPPSGEECSSSSRLQNKVTVAWDFSSGQRIPFQAINYGQELYDQAAQNLAKSLHGQRQNCERSSNSVEQQQAEDNCYDYSRPGINSSKYASTALEKAIESLKDVPTQVESMLKKDKRFEPAVMSKATKSLNVSRTRKIYKNLIPVDPNPDVRTETENFLQAEIKRTIEAARPPSRTKEPEPKLENYQSNSYTRIRPLPVPPPPKPSRGISIDFNSDFNTIEEDNLLREESNRF